MWSDMLFSSFYELLGKRLSFQSPKLEQSSGDQDVPGEARKAANQGKNHGHIKQYRDEG